MLGYGENSRVPAMTARRAPHPAPEPRPIPPAAPRANRVPVARAYMPAIEAALPYLHRLDQSRWYSNYGPLVEELERRLADRFSTPTTVATVSSATSALTIGLQALMIRDGGLRPEGVCAMPAWTFVATAHAVAQAGLRPWFVDVDPETWMLDPGALREVMNQAPGPVQGVIPVSAFGHMPDVAAWKRFRADTAIPVLIDAAAAFDALDDAAIPSVVSLHATKILGTGEGGYLATEDPEFAVSIRTRTVFGFHGDRIARVIAANAKLSEYAAALGHASLDQWASTRMRYMQAAQRMRIALIDTPVVRFQPGWGSDWISATCVVGLPDGSADFVDAALAEEGIETRHWWGSGCHRAPAFSGAARTALPVTDRLARSTIGLPFALDMDEDLIGRIADAVRRAVSAYAGERS